jgi:hypothetical protein
MLALIPGNRPQTTPKVSQGKRILYLRHLEIRSAATHFFLLNPSPVYSDRIFGAPSSSSFVCPGDMMSAEKEKIFNENYSKPTKISHLDIFWHKNCINLL